MYTTRNFKTKKALKQAGPFGGNEPTDGWITLEGPHYPEPHRWYARAEVKDGAIVKVK